MKRKPGERLNDDYVVSTSKHDGGTVIVWGREGWEFDTGQEIMKKEQCHLILQWHAISSNLYKFEKNSPSIR